jgi:hypothetical protein
LDNTFKYSPVDRTRVPHDKKQTGGLLRFQALDKSYSFQKLMVWRLKKLTFSKDNALKVFQSLRFQIGVSVLTIN